ncbi:acyltransferase [Chryseotalea sanaruensis]|uniref:Acyltransferase n=1 Tax=Chryseotalea sanaruensis TaxID=2482724 RepID=A0A401UC32_9BACT|nr:acyltransferase [Chryseotalea sanaruensis]GCC52461.1 acyltransferase [Chryseotalea sanaruensis]
MERHENIFKHYVWQIIRFLPLLNILYFTRGTQNPVTLKFLFWQKIIGFNRGAYWPIHFSSVVNNWRNVYAGIDVCPGYSPGCYIQAIGKVFIGDYTQIAPNVGIISANHELNDNRKHVVKDVVIGKYCWLGMNSIVLPGTELGDFTVVAAGAVVTKSFPSGYCVLGGNPARVIKELNKEECVSYKNKYEYLGYIKASKFPQFRKKHLSV